MDSIFPIRLKSLRKANKKRQEDIAKVLGVQRATYSGYERGVIMPPFDKIKALASYFDVSVHYLTGTENNEVKENDISKSLALLLQDLQDETSTITIDGIKLDEESRDLLISSLESSVKMSKLIAKKGK